MIFMKYIIHIFYFLYIYLHNFTTYYLKIKRERYFYEPILALKLLLDTHNEVIRAPTFADFTRR